MELTAEVIVNRFALHLAKNAVVWACDKATVERTVLLPTISELSFDPLAREKRALNVMKINYSPQGIMNGRTGILLFPVSGAGGVPVVGVVDGLTVLITVGGKRAVSSPQRMVGGSSDTGANSNSRSLKNLSKTCMPPRTSTTL